MLGLKYRFPCRMQGWSVIAARFLAPNETLLVLLMCVHLSNFLLACSMLQGVE